MKTPLEKQPSSGGAPDLPTELRRFAKTQPRQPLATNIGTEMRAALVDLQKMEAAEPPREVVPGVRVPAPQVKRRRGAVWLIPVVAVGVAGVTVLAWLRPKPVTSIEPGAPSTVEAPPTRRPDVDEAARPAAPTVASTAPLATDEPAASALPSTAPPPMTAAPMTASPSTKPIHPAAPTAPVRVVPPVPTLSPTGEDPSGGPRRFGKN